jgi:hypothetical protein
MKSLKLPLAVATIVLFVFLGQLTAESAQATDDFAAFKNKMLALPARQESVARMAMGSIMPLVAINNHLQLDGEISPVTTTGDPRPSIMDPGNETRFGRENATPS